MGDFRRRWALAFVGVCVLVLVAAWPGLRGGWVGDDVHMLDSPLYGDWSEVFRVFSRHAGHYLGDTVNPSLVAPYRPFTMFTLMFTHVLVPEPWLHHVASWLMHVSAGGLLFYALLRQTLPERHASSRPVSLVVAALFLLHPVTVESYVFINGRSDLLAGLCLAALAAVLSRESLPRSVRWVLVALTVFFGAASKVTFVPAALAVWLGLSLRSEQRRDAWMNGVPLGVALSVFLALRAANVPFSGRLGASENLLGDASVLADLPQLLAKGVAAIVTFQSEAMQSLAWELSQPFSIGEWIGGLVFIAAMVALAVRRDFGGVALTAGFALTLAPCVVVSRAFWLGFDRYLYMPLVLVCLAIAPHVVAAAEATPRRRASWIAVAVVLVGVAALGTRASSLAYIDQITYEAAITDEHPDDPTIAYYMALVATNGDQVTLARQRLSRIPDPPWPVAIVVRTADLADELSDERMYDTAVDYGLRVLPGDPEVRAHGMRWRYARGELPDALALARTFADEEGCAEARQRLESWLREDQPSEAREQIQATVRGLPCDQP